MIGEEGATPQLKSEDFYFSSQIHNYLIKAKIVCKREPRIILCYHTTEERPGQKLGWTSANLMACISQSNYKAKEPRFSLP